MKKNSDIIIEKALQLDKSKQRRYIMSARRIINEYMIDRVWKDKKDASDRKFKTPTRNYLDFKTKLLSGNIKGRGGRPSKTLKAYKDRLRKANQHYKAKSSSDTMQLSGLLITKFNTDKVNIISQRSGRWRLTWQNNLLNGGKDQSVEDQVRGLKRRGYDPLGFNTIPRDLRLKIQQAFIRITNG